MMPMIENIFEFMFVFGQCKFKPLSGNLITYTFPSIHDQMSIHKLIIYHVD